MAVAAIGGRRGRMGSMADPYGYCGAAGEGMLGYCRKQCYGRHCGGFVAAMRVMS